MQDGEGSTAQRGRAGSEAAGVQTAGQGVCVLHVVADTVSDRTSSDHAEVKAAFPNETVVKYHK